MVLAGRVDFSLSLAAPLQAYTVAFWFNIPFPANELTKETGTTNRDIILKEDGSAVLFTEAPGLPLDYPFITKETGITSDRLISESSSDSIVDEASAKQRQLIFGEVGTVAGVYLSGSNLVLQTRNMSIVAILATGIQQNRWYHLAVVVNTSDSVHTVVPYLNGQSTGFSSDNTNGEDYSLSPSCLGQNDSTDAASNCSVDDIIIYNAALTDVDIYRIYRSSTLRHTDLLRHATPTYLPFGGSSENSFVPFTITGVSSSNSNANLFLTGVPNTANSGGNIFMAASEVPRLTSPITLFMSSSIIDTLIGSTQISIFSETFGPSSSIPIFLVTDASGINVSNMNLIAFGSNPSLSANVRFTICNTLLGSNTHVPMMVIGFGANPGHTPKADAMNLILRTAPADMVSMIICGPGVSTNNNVQTYISGNQSSTSLVNMILPNTNTLVAAHPTLYTHGF